VTLAAHLGSVWEVRRAENGISDGVLVTAREGSWGATQRPEYEQQIFVGMPGDSLACQEFDVISELTRLGVKKQKKNTAV
jgi:hypothetical protein